MSREFITLSHHFLEQQRNYPNATGKFTDLLLQIGVAAKRVSYQVNKAGLMDILGSLGYENVYGESVQKLDMFSHNIYFDALDHMGLLCAIASEEQEEFIPIPEKYPTGPYVFLFDPLDGSSNIDANVSIGTIFSIHRKISQVPRGAEEDCLQPGRKQVCAGYILYGSSTMLVYTAGKGVHGFTLDPGVGEFVLSHPNMQFPSPEKSKNILSINMGNYNQWDSGTQKYIDSISRFSQKPYTYRYVGSLVADFHRTLLYGGIFLYPGSHQKDAKNPYYKLRLLYEAAPLAFIAEQARGKASTGKENILNIFPDSLQYRVPLAIGTKYDVEAYEAYLASIGS
ncbi:MAG: class 1 fructose-bisphosphatase [Candidatus Brocadiae bacterium]|nr:class 1 fructose-bisphosphatase [Candidatus Brocadiia bacterium]